MQITGPLRRIYDRMKLLPGLPVLTDATATVKRPEQGACAAHGHRGPVARLRLEFFPPHAPSLLSSRISEDASRRSSHLVRTQVVTQPSRSEPDERTKTESGDEESRRVVPVSELTQRGLLQVPLFLVSI